MNKILSELVLERERIDQAIKVLETVAEGQRRRGRKPAWMKFLENHKRKARGSPSMSKSAAASSDQAAG